jgi:hypothetical protein
METMNVNWKITKIRSSWDVYIWTSRCVIFIKMIRNSSQHNKIKTIKLFLIVLCWRLFRIISWVVAPCSLVKINWRFKGAYCLHHHRPDNGGSTHLWNVCLLQRDYTVIYPWTTEEVVKEQEKLIRQQKGVTNYVYISQYQHNFSKKWDYIKNE